MEKVPMTRQGLDSLEEEFRRLRNEERPAVIKAIAAAREHGDLSENAEYHAARERQSFIEGRLAELEDVISRADVIDVSKLSGDIVRFGASVIVVDEDTDEEIAYQIVGAHEADLEDGLIDVIIVRKSSSIKLFNVFPKLFNGSHISSPLCEYVQVKSLEINPKINTPLNIDGEIIGETPAKLNVLPRYIDLLM